jgi:hypothetical protein
MREGSLSPRHVRDVLRCEYTHDLLVFDQFLNHRDGLVRIAASEIVVAHGDASMVVDAIMKETDTFVVSGMLEVLGKHKYKEVDDLRVLFRADDCVIAENAFKLFVKVGRADLLFPLVMKGDERTKERVRRYLNEQGWL